MGIVKFNKNAKQEREKIPEKLAGVQPSGGLWSQLKEHFESTPFSLFYYVKADKLRLLNFLLSMPWLCGWLLAWMLSITFFTEFSLLPDHRSGSNHSDSNKSTDITSQPTGDNSFSGLLPIPFNQVFLAFMTNLFALIMLRIVAMPLRYTIRRTRLYFQALDELINHPPPRYGRWKFRVLAFLAMAAVTHTTAGWFQQATSVLSFLHCPSLSCPKVTVSRLLRMTLFVYAAVPMMSIVLLPGIVFPSRQSLEEFQQALKQRLKLRKIAGIDV